MADAVRDFLAAGIASTVRVASTPEAPFGYGADLSGADDLDPLLAEVDGFSTLAIAQALARRLGTPRGGLPDDATYGEDLTEWCNRGHSSAEIRDLARRIAAECQKDDRVRAVRVTVAPDATARTFDVTVAVDPHDAALGTFTLTLAVSSAGVILEALE